MFTYLYILLITKTNIMQTFSTILLVAQFILFVIVLGNIATLFTNYLLTKIK